MFKWLLKRTPASYASDTEDTASLIPGNASGEPVRMKGDRRARQYLTIALLAIAFPLTALIGAYWGGRHFASRSDRYCLNQASNYSPLLDDIDITFSDVDFNGSFFKNTKFQLSAGPEVDEAWKSLGVDYGVMIVPKEQGLRAGLREDMVQVQDKYGGGFPANIEGLHHLHCLDLLRKATYFNYDHYYAEKKGPFKNSDGIIYAHVSHCIDILRQQLMCTVDIGILGQVWWNPDEPTAFPDFNTRHKCRNFEAVRQWAYEHLAATEEVPIDILQPPKNKEEIPDAVP